MENLIKALLVLIAVTLYMEVPKEKVYCCWMEENKLRCVDGVVLIHEDKKLVIPEDLLPTVKEHFRVEERLKL